MQKIPEWCREKHEDTIPGFFMIKNMLKIQIN